MPKENKKNGENKLQHKIIMFYTYSTFKHEMHSDAHLQLVFLRQIKIAV